MINMIRLSINFRGTSTLFDCGRQFYGKRSQSNWPQTTTVMAIYQL